LNILRIKFFRGEEVKYISHLDLMKLFERALRRAKIQIAYSQGFNPHPQMVFGLPLSVGVTSEAEYADFEFTTGIKANDFIERLNKELPKGMLIVEAAERKSRDNIMATISAASYDILLSSDEKREMGSLNNSIDQFLQLPSINAKKENKHGVREIDIRPMIYDVKIKDLEVLPTKDAYGEVEKETTIINQYLDKLQDDKFLPPSYSLENIFCLSVILSAGSVANLKAELFVTALCDFMETGVRLVKTHRTGLFVGTADRLISPLDESIL